MAHVTSSGFSSDEETDGVHKLDPITEAVYQRCFEESGPFPPDAKTVAGYDFNGGIDYKKLVGAYARVGYQAAHLGKAIDAINKMIDARHTPIPDGVRTEHHKDFLIGNRRYNNCTIYLSYTSNLVSSGLRDIIRYLVEHNMVDCILTAAAGIEEDLMKCMSEFYHGDFQMDSEKLYELIHGRQGNLLIPNNAYRALNNFTAPIFDAMREEQMDGVNWTPQKLIWRLGKEINNPKSIYYWCYKNQIPVFCPGIIDGAIGDNLYFHQKKYRDTALKIDCVEDAGQLTDIAIHSTKSGGIILGAGVPKHQVLNTNSYKDGLDYAVYVNTAAEFDGSDSGASPQEAVTWAKINPKAKPVKVFADATIIFPLLVAETFAKREKEFKDFKPNVPKKGEYTDYYSK